MLQLAAAPGVPVPDLVDLEVYWSHTTTVAKLRVPFPAKGVRAFDGAGHKLADGALLAAQHLAGTRWTSIIDRLFQFENARSFYCTLSAPASLLRRLSKV